MNTPEISCDLATHVFHDTEGCADHIVESLKRFGIEASHLAPDDMNSREIRIETDYVTERFLFVHPNTEIRVVESPDGKSWRTMFKKPKTLESNDFGHYSDQGVSTSNILEETSQFTLSIPQSWDGTNEQYLLIEKWLKSLGPYKTRLNEDEKRIEISARSTRGRDRETYIYSDMRFWLNEYGVVKTEIVDPAEEDAVNHPSHYTDGQIEVSDFIADKDLNFFAGNVVKYICRAGKKDPSKHVEDLEKAKWYLTREIQRQKEV